MKVVWLLFVLCFALFFTQPVSAHVFGQPPYFLVNGEYANFYKAPASSLSSITLPQDGTNTSYLINKPIHFALDVNKLPAPPEVVKKTKFTWDFGDKSKGEGLSNDHTYTKMGSYILSIYAYDPSVPEPQLLETALLNIVPDLNYKLPNPVIKLNGKTTKDPMNNVVPVRFGVPLTFDSSDTTDPSSKIVSLQWDFGDGQGSTDKITSHTFATTLSQSQYYPLLRIVDANGFIGDTFVAIRNDPNAKTDIPQPTGAPPAKNTKSQSSWIFLALGIGFIVILFFAVSNRRKKSKL